MKGHNLTRKQIEKAVEILSEAPEYDRYFLSNGRLYGGKEITRLPNSVREKLCDLTVDKESKSDM